MWFGILFTVLFGLMVIVGFVWCILLYLAVIKTDKGEYYPRTYKFYSKIFKWDKE